MSKVYESPEHSAAPRDDEVARLRGVTAGEIEAATTTNARRLFELGQLVGATRLSPTT